MNILLSIATSPPVNNTNNSFAFVGQFLATAIAFAVVIVLAYYSTKWIASSRVVRQAKGNIKILESVSLGFQSTLQLVKVADKLILIGVTKEKVTFLTELEPEALKPINESGQANPFEKYLNRLLPKKKDS